MSRRLSIETFQSVLASFIGSVTLSVRVILPLLVLRKGRDREAASLDSDTAVPSGLGVCTLFGSTDGSSTAALSDTLAIPRWAVSKEVVQHATRFAANIPAALLGVA